MDFLERNFNLLVYVLLWAILFVTHRRRVRDWTACNIIVLLCFSLSIVSLLLYNSPYFRNDYGVLSLFPFIYLFFMFWLTLLPSIKYDNAKVQYIQMPSSIFVKLFMFGFAISSICMLPKMFSTLQSGLVLLFLDESAGRELYLLKRETHVASDNSVSGLYGLITIFYGFFKDIAIFFFYYYLCLKEKSKLYIALYLVVLIAGVLISIAQGGRTPFIMNLYVLIIGFFIFYPYWNQPLKKIAKKASVVILILLSVPFIVLTISRFSYRTASGGTLGGILSYAGQAPLNFNLYAMDAGGIRYGDRTCNSFKRMLGFDVPNGISEVRDKYAHMKLNDGLFSTFVGDFVLDFGPFIALMLFILFSIVFIRLSRPNGNTILFHHLLLVFFTLIIVAQGAMYLFYYSFLNNYVIVAFFLVYIALQYDYKNQKHINYIHRNM